jgi:hypothetical protein
MRLKRTGNLNIYYTVEMKKGKMKRRAECLSTCYATKSAALPHLSSLSPLLQALNIVSPKWLATTYAPGLLKTAACAAYYMDRFIYKYDGLPTSHKHANRPHIFSHNLLSII